jgi:hypothetical protein
MEASRRLAVPRGTEPRLKPIECNRADRPQLETRQRAAEKAIAPLSEVAQVAESTFRSNLEEQIWIDVRLLQNRPKRTLRHIAWWFGTVVYRFIWGLNQISWLPAACRSKRKPHLASFRATSR